MNIIDWVTEVPKVTLPEKQKKEIFIRLLGGIDRSKQWVGEVCLKSYSKDKMEAPYVAIRNAKGDAQILVQVGVQKTRYMHGQPYGKIHTEPTVLMSQNGTAEYQVDDFAEVNLAVLEAWEVYKALVEEKENA